MRKRLGKDSILTDRRENAGVARDDLAKRFESFRTHRNKRGIQSLQDNGQNGVEGVTKMLTSANLLGQPVYPCYFLVRASAPYVNKLISAKDV